MVPSRLCESARRVGMALSRARSKRRRIIAPKVKRIFR